MYGLLHRPFLAPAEGFGLWPRLLWNVGQTKVYAHFSTNLNKISNNKRNIEKKEEDIYIYKYLFFSS